MEKINKKTLHTLLHDKRFLVYVLIDILLVFALNFYYLHLTSILLYAIMIVVVSFLILTIKNLVSSMFHVKIAGKSWISGLIFSAISTLVASSAGIPIPIPVISYNKYERESTIRGIKKGAVNIHEIWEITFFSSLILLFIAFIFISLYNYFKDNAFLISGIAIAMFVLVDFLPEKHFNGTNLVYHNVIIYSITFIFLILIGIFSIVNYTISFAFFITFIAFTGVTYILKLW